MIRFKIHRFSIRFKSNFCKFRTIQFTIKFDSRFKVQGSLLFVTYTIIQGIIGSEMLIRTGPLNGKCKKKIKKHNNNIKAIKTMKQNAREYIYIYIQIW